MTQSHDITALLGRWQEGDRAALDELLPEVYQELRRLARHHLGNERVGHTLQPTALVHEAFLRLGNYEQISWQDRAHFFSVASRIMRRVLVDHARKRDAAKRGGSAVAVTLSDSLVPGHSANVDFIALDQALTQLEGLDQRQSQTVELRFFGGLEHKEIADVLGVSVATVNRDWRVAKLWLRRALAGPESSHG